jgi:hypothetical protein
MTGSCVNFLTEYLLNPFQKLGMKLFVSQNPNSGFPALHANGGLLLKAINGRQSTLN